MKMILEAEPAIVSLNVTVWDTIVECCYKISFILSHAIIPTTDISSKVRCKKQGNVGGEIGQFKKKDLSNQEILTLDGGSPKYKIITPSLKIQYLILYKVRRQYLILVKDKINLQT